VRSFRTQKVISELLAIGHTNVVVRRGALASDHDPHGGPGFYHFTSDQQPTEYTLGRSMNEALDWIRYGSPW
jgi:hypothetical protein